MNVEFASVSTWFNPNNLSVNIDKTKSLLFHPLSKRQLLPQTLPILLFENIHIKREHVAKFLGVFIDENLSWKQHIDRVGSKISNSMVIYYKSKDVLSKQCLKDFSFIHNYVNYTNITWASTGKCKLERLYHCQKHAGRLVYHKDWYTHASLLLNDIKTLNVFKLNILNILCFMYKYMKNSNPPVFRNIFE